MSVDTNAILFGSPSQEEVAAALRAEFDVPVIVTETAPGENMFRVIFPEPAGKLSDSPENRMMFVLPDNENEDHEDVYSGKHTYCMLGAWGSSVAIMEALAKRFGGFVRDSDSNDDWRRFEASPDTAPELSDEDVLRIELSAALGGQLGSAIASLVSEPEKLDRIMEIYASYVERKKAAAPAP